MSMSDIRIRRFENHPHGWVGAVEPDDKRWQVCIDEEGRPKLFVRVFAEVDGERVSGLLDFDQVSNVSIAEVLDSEIGGEMTPDEEHGAWEEIQASGYRCPV